MQERRRSRRLPRNERASINTHAVTGHGVELIDISTGGMRLHSSQELPVGSTVTSKLNISPQVGAFHIQGTIAWNKPAADGNGYEVGVTFTKVSAKPF